MQRLLLSLPYGMSVRNFLGSRIVASLRRQFAVRLATPLYNDPALHQEFGADMAEAIDLPKARRPSYLAYRYLLDMAEGYHFTKRTRIGTLATLSDCLRRDRPGAFVRRNIVGAVLSSNPRMFDWLRRLQCAFMRMPYYPALFAQMKPDLIVQTHPLSLDEFPLALYAQRAKIPVVAMLHSWDNLTAKSGLRVVTSNRPGRMLPIQYDHMLVWNETQRNELIRYYHYRPEQITVTGVPQFDFYLKHRFPDRESFCRKHGLDPRKKLIVFTAGSSVLLPRQNEIVDMLVEAVTAGAFDMPTQLLIRAHPGKAMDYLRLLEGRADVRIQYPRAGYVAERVTGGWTNAHDEQSEFAETLYHADVVVNVASTVCLDCAALDRPIVCVAFDGHRNNRYHHSILKHYHFDHFQPVMDSGGVRVAYSREELMQSLRAYLADPRLDSEGRARLRAVGCYRVDGGAAERVAEALTTFAYGTQGACTVGA